MDKLFIDENITLSIEEWVVDNKGLLIEGGFLNKNTPLPFNEIMIVMEYSDEKVEMTVHGKSFNEILISMLNSYGKEIFSCTIFDFVTAYRGDLGYDFGYQMGINFVDKGLDFNDIEDEVFKESVRRTSAMICEIMIYIMFHKEDVKLEKRVTSNSKHKSKKQQKNKKRKVYIERHYKLIGIERNNVAKSSNKRKYMAESWAVRGHMRKCKNGKITFVKPYVKGKGRKVDKDYKL